MMRSASDALAGGPHRDRLIAGFAALAIAIHILEAAFPSPLPGVKPGLANVVTVVVLVRYGWATAAWVAALRVLAGSLLVGTFLSPTFVMSASGAVAAMSVLGFAWLAGRALLGALGYSVLAALAHMGAQIAVARALFIPHDAILKLVPFLMTAAVLFGIVSGVIAASVLEILERRAREAAK